MLVLPFVHHPKRSPEVKKMSIFLKKVEKSLAGRGKSV
jgi:hypothetical protein